MYISIEFPHNTSVIAIQKIASAIEALRNMNFTNNKFQFVLGYPNSNAKQIVVEIPDMPISSGFITMQTGNSLGGGNTGHIHIQSGRGKTP